MNDKYILCICEGNFEITIMEMLLERHLLPFEKERLVEEKFIKRGSVANISRNYLNRKFDKPVYILRIIDSKSEKFKLSKEYLNKVNKIIDIITKPEIEILIIISENDYEKFTNSPPEIRRSPSSYCKSEYGMKNVKSKKFVKEYFNDISKLKTAIKTHRTYTKDNIYMLQDLLDNKMKL